MFKPTNVNVLGFLAARYGPSEGAMGHWGVVLGASYPFWTSPMLTVILKCQIRLFYDLKITGYLAFLLWVLELYLMFGQKWEIYS